MPKMGVAVGNIDQVRNSGLVYRRVRWYIIGNGKDAWRTVNALLVIDVQKGYMERYDARLLQAINRRIREAVEQDTLVVYVHNVRHLKSGDVVNAFADGLEIGSPHVVLKDRASVFSNGLLQDLLRENCVKAIEVIGIDGCCCVAQSAIDARALGFDVTVPCAYIGVKTPERFAKKRLTLEKLGIRVTD